MFGLHVPSELLKGAIATWASAGSDAPLRSLQFAFCFHPVVAFIAGTPPSIIALFLDAGHLLFKIVALAAKLISFVFLIGHRMTVRAKEGSLILPTISVKVCRHAIGHTTIDAAAHDQIGIHFDANCSVDHHSTSASTNTRPTAPTISAM